MENNKLSQDRFLRKDPQQTDGTKGAVYTASNPAPKRGDDNLRKIGRSKGSEEDDGAPNILTGTVITSCFIQTSALPSRIELQGNDITFFDDTYHQGGEIIGDTSRLIFTHGSGVVGGVVEQGFVWEKRSSTRDAYDNVLQLYGLEPKEDKMNYLFFGMEGTGDNAFTNSMQFVVNHSNNPVTQDIANGIFSVTGVTDGAINTAAPPVANLGVFHNSILSIPGEGYSVFMTGTGTGGIYVNGSIGLVSGPRWSSGTGSPETVVTAPIGSLYSNLSGGASTTLYVKTSGTGNTGWTAK